MEIIHTTSICVQKRENTQSGKYFIFTHIAKNFYLKLKYVGAKYKRHSVLTLPDKETQETL